MTVEAFEQVKLANDEHCTNEELLKSLSQLKKQQAKSLLVVDIQGRGEEKSPCFFPEIHKQLAKFFCISTRKGTLSNQTLPCLQ